MVHIFIKIEFLKIFLLKKIRRPNKASFLAAMIFFIEIYVFPGNISTWLYNFQVKHVLGPLVENTIFSEPFPT